MRQADSLVVWMPPGGPGLGGALLSAAQEPWIQAVKVRTCSVVHETKDMNGVLHGDDFVWEGIDEDLDWVQKLLEDKYELKNRGRLGFGPNDVRKIDMLGRVIELPHEGITWQGDPRHFNLLQEYFGMDDKTKVLTKNGYEEAPSRLSCEKRSCRWRSARRSG